MADDAGSAARRELLAHMREMLKAVRLLKNEMSAQHPDDPAGQREYLKQAHAIRFLGARAGRAPRAARVDGLMPKARPRGTDALTQAHWLLWSNPLPPLGTVYRTVWTDILTERVTDDPVRAR